MLEFYPSARAGVTAHYRIMTARPPADVGMSLDEVDTPALIIELDAFEDNLSRMAQAARTAGVRLRPHAKTHKCAC